MKYSRLFGKTIRSTPADISSVSHKFLYQAGFIRELTAGRYELLPLGFRVFEKVMRVIQEGMEEIGSQRVVTPTLHPKEVWQKTGRDAVWGKNLLSVKDARTEQEFTLSATAEGLFTEMVAGFSPSYKDLPILVHQFSQKFRNEKRPRGGLLRLREFVMKDAYSFDADEESFKKTYQLFYDAYLKIAQRFDLNVLPVEADNGALGGDYSHEFMIEADFGEDKIVKCGECDYAANVEKAVFKKEKSNDEMKEYEIVKLPREVATIKELVAHYKMPAEKFIKNVVYKTSDGRIIIATITGNLEVNEIKLQRLLKIDTDFETATDEDLASFGAKFGFVHSWGYMDKRITYVVDDSIVNTRNLYGGLKTETTDPINVNYDRDFKADLVGDIASAPDGALCARCGTGKLRLIRAIEFGHVFQYGHFYSKAHDGYFVDHDGSRKLMNMGAYGIGLERTIATIVETHNDEKGIVWPEAVAPFKFHLIGIQGKGEGVYKKLLDAGCEVLFDDREISPGAKFADADLIGIPWRLVVSEKTGDKIEVKGRNQSEAKLMDLESVISL